MEALDIHSVYMAEINKVASNTREPIHCDTSNPFDLCGNTGHTFDECDILKNHNFLKRNCIQFSLCKKWLNQPKTDLNTALTSYIDTTNYTGVFDPYVIMGQE